MNHLELFQDTKSILIKFLANSLIIRGEGILVYFSPHFQTSIIFAFLVGVLFTYLIEGNNRYFGVL